MSTFTGIIRYNDLEGGFFELVTESGEVYRLSRCSAKTGDRVQVKGTVEQGGFSIHMTSPSIAVSAIEVL